MPNLAPMIPIARKCRSHVAIALVLAFTACDDPVSPSPTVADVEIQNSQATVHISVRESLTLIAVARDQSGATLDNITILWSVRDTAVARITATGMVTGLMAGETVVFARAGSRSDTVLIQIARVPVERIEVALDSFYIGSGYSFQLSAETIDTFGVRDAEYPFVWSSSDSTIARVDQTGNVQALRPGTAEIRVRASPHVARATVHVEPAYKGIYISWRHSCALTMDGRAFCWGNNQDGKLGTGDVMSSAAPTAVAGGHRFSQLTLGQEFTCGLQTDGVVMCWGRNALGELGTGDTIQRSLEPTPIAASGTFRQVVAGEDHACALQISGQALCWGDNVNAVLGIGTSQRYIERTPTPVAGSALFKQLASGAWTTTCGLETDGKYLCWGTAAFTHRGDEAACGLVCSAPVEVTGVPDFTSIAGSYRRWCGVEEGGRAYCWSVASPLPLPIPDVRFDQIGSGVGLQMCGVSEAGKAYCWPGEQEPVVLQELGGDLLMTNVVGGDESYLARACGISILGVAFCWHDSLLEPPTVLARPG